MNPLGRRLVVASAASLASGAASPAAAYVRAGAAGRPANVQSARTGIANRNLDANGSVNVNENRGCYSGGSCYDHWGHPVAAAVAVTTTAAAVGTIATSLPPSGCSAITAGGVAYQKCGPNYYQPEYSNGTTQYVVVHPPQ